MNENSLKALENENEANGKCLEEESSGIEKEFIQKHNLTMEVGEVIDLVENNLSKSQMCEISQNIRNAVNILKSGTDEKVSNCDIAWQAKCAIIYSKTKRVLDNSTNVKDITALYKEWTEKGIIANKPEVHSVVLQFVPEKIRNLPICKDVIQILAALSKLATTFAKAELLGVEYWYFSGGIVLFHNTDFLLKDFQKGKMLFHCPYMKHISGTRLFQFSKDQLRWGLIDDTGRVLAPDVFEDICFRS